MPSNCPPAIQRIITIAMLLPGVAWPRNEARAQAPEPQRIDVVAIAPRITALVMAPDGTVLVASGERGTLVVDAGAPALAGRVDSAVTALASAPVRWVVNTHYHEDHRGANPRFRATGADVIAHADMVVEARRDTMIAELAWQRTAAPADALPTRTFADSIAIDLGGEVAIVFHVPAAHTRGDAMVLLRRANVVHTGDVVEFGAYPFVDRWAGGSIEGLIRAVDVLLSRTDAQTRLVPGHGPPFGRVELVTYRDMLVTLAGRVRDAITAGETVEQLLEAGITGAYDELHGGARHGRRFVQLLYAELEAAEGSAGDPGDHHD